MKVSAVLVGVNVAATLSVAAQGQALADDGTAAFLKSSLTELKAEPALSLGAASKSSASVPQKSLKRSSTKMSLSDPQAVATRSTLAGTGGVKLRAFNPNRKLPTRKELEVAFQAQQASYDPTPVQEQIASQPLSGGIAEYASPYYVSSEYAEPYVSARGKRALGAQERRATSERINKAAKTATSFVRKAAPRVVPGSMPAVPGQAGFPCAQAPVQNFEPVGMNPQMMAHMQMMQQQQMAVQAPIEPPLAPPNLNPQQQAEMNRLIQAACTRANGGGNMNFSPSLLQQNMMQQQQGQGDLYQRVGPPPFPLSLIPEPALKDFVRGGKTQRSSIAAAAQPAGFGAWHGSGGMGAGATTTGSAISQALPRGGFRSYSQSVNGFKSYSRMPSSLSVKHHAHKGGHAHSGAHAKHSASGNHGPTQIAARAPETKVYAPYESHVNFGTH